MNRDLILTSLSRHSRWISGAVIFLCATFLLQWSYRPYAAAARELLPRKQALQSDLGRLRSGKAPPAQIAGEEKELAAHRSRLSRWIPKNLATAELTSTLNVLSQKAGIHLSDIRIEPPSQLGIFQNTPVRLQVKGSPASVCQFMKEIAGIERLVALVSLSFRMSSNASAEAELSLGAISQGERREGD